MDITLLRGKVLHPSVTGSREPLICRDTAGSNGSAAGLPGSLDRLSPSRKRYATPPYTALVSVAEGRRRAWWRSFS